MPLARPASMDPNRQTRIGLFNAAMAANPIRKPPAMPAASPYPAAPSLGSSGAMNEQDMAAHLMRKLDPYSTMVRSGQDQGWQQQATANTMQVAAGNPAPVRIGIAPKVPTTRPGLMSVPVSADGPPAPAAPMAPMTPVPGRDTPFVPSAIDPQKNTWRANQGSSTANWRLHPGMVPPPPESLPQVRRPVAQPGTATDPQAVMAGRLNEGLQKAMASGDLDALARHGGELAALNKRGFSGLIDHQHAAAMQEAEREQVGAKIGVLDRQGGGRIGIAPEQAYASTLAKTGDPAAAGQAYQWQRIAQNEATAKANGQPVQVNPDDAGMILDRKYPSIAHLFQPNGNGVASGGDLAALYSNLNAIRPPGFDDPKSEFSQAAGARIRQLYGSGLPGQLTHYSDPAQVERDLGSVTHVPLLGPAVKWLGGYANNMFNNGSFSFAPETRFNYRQPAVDWFNRISPTK